MKWHGMGQPDIAAFVTLSARVWIEIITFANGVTHEFVTLSARVWIEIKTP